MRRHAALVSVTCLSMYGFGIHGGSPEPLGIHLTKTFVSLQNKPVGVIAFAIDKALYLLVCPSR